MGKGWISHSKCWTEWEEVLVGSQCNGVSQSCSARLDVFRLVIRNFGRASERQVWWKWRWDGCFSLCFMQKESARARMGLNERRKEQDERRDLKGNG